MNRTYEKRQPGEWSATAFHWSCPSWWWRQGTGSCLAAFVVVAPRHWFV